MPIDDQVLLDAHQWKQVSDFEMALCQNKSETTKAIKEAKTPCAYAIREAEAHCTMLISEAETWHTTCIKEAKANCATIMAEVENGCSMAIRKVGSHSAKQAHSIQQSHGIGMQGPEAEVIKKEGKYCLSFLTACGADLWASSLKDHRVLVTPFHLLLGNAPLSTLLIIHPQYLLPNMSLPHCLLILLHPWHLSPLPHLNSDTPPQSDCIPTSIGSHPKSCPKEHPTQREGMKCLFTKH